MSSGQPQEVHPQVLRTLRPREERVIKRRFGLEGGSEHTLEEVGQSFQVTREGIRKIEATALRPERSEVEESAFCLGNAYNTTCLVPGDHTTKV